MKSNPLHHRLLDGQPCRGVWLTLPSPETARLVASVAADWYCIDLEHSPMGIPRMAAMVGALADVGCPVLVRMPANRTEYVKWSLDVGAVGVIAPMIETRDQAAELVALAKYPPTGSRSHGSPWAGLAWGVSMTEYQRLANTQTLCLAQVETARGFDEIRDIAATPDLDGVFVGPVDLAISLDAQGHHSGIEAAIAEIGHVAQLYSITAGIFCRSPREAQQRIQQGYQLVIVATDVLVLMDGLQEAIAWRKD